MGTGAPRGGGYVIESQRDKRRRFRTLRSLPEVGLDGAVRAFRDLVAGLAGSDPWARARAGRLLRLRRVGRVDGQGCGEKRSGAIVEVVDIERKRAALLADLAVETAEARVAEMVAMGGRD